MWYAANMNILCDWLSDRMEAQLHLHQLNTLIRVVGVSSRSTQQNSSSHHSVCTVTDYIVTTTVLSLLSSPRCSDYWTVFASNSLSPEFPLPWGPLAKGDLVDHVLHTLIMYKDCLGIMKEQCKNSRLPHLLMIVVHGETLWSPAPQPMDDDDDDDGAHEEI